MPLFCGFSFIWLSYSMKSQSCGRSLAQSTKPICARWVGGFRKGAGEWPALRRPIQHIEALLPLHPHFSPPTALVMLADPFAKEKLQLCLQKPVSKVVQATRQML